MTTQTDPEDELVNDIASFTHDPLGYIRYAFPWGEGELEHNLGPRTWQRDEADALGKHLRNPATRFKPYRLAIATGHGTGKSAFISMIVNWALDTHEDTKVIVTSNTDTQLQTKTWAEVTKWLNLSITQSDGQKWKQCTATAIYSLEPGHEKTWRADAIPWNEKKPESFAGAHNQRKRLVIIFDEASAIHDKIWEVVEGALTDEHTEIIWIVFGNPTRNTGRFRECFGKYANLWRHRQIDSRTVEGTNKEQLDEWVATYGEDSDFVRVRVRGQFPRAGSTQFISSEVVDTAAKREAIAHLSDALVLGVDVARFGDDESVIQPRRGRDARTHPSRRFRGLDTMQLAAKVLEYRDDLARMGLPADAIFVDETGVGGGVIDRLRQLGQRVIGVNNGAASDSAIDGEMVANKGAECWARMRQWLNQGAIADDPDLRQQLEGREYGFNAHNEIVLEKKSDMKKRGLSSPDRADALCFVAGTMVLTPDGERPIECLKEGDLVVTPLRSARVVKRWESQCDHLTTVRFTNGRLLCGKGEHKVFTWDHGFVRLDALALTSMLEPSTVARRAVWRMLRLLFIKARNTEFKARVDIISQGERVTRSAFFTAGSGRTTMGRFRTVCMSITSTMTGAITALKTLLCSIAPSISVGTLGRDWQPLSARSKPCMAWRKAAQPQPYGMDLMQDCSGTVSTGRRHGGDASQPQSSAESVDWVTRHSFPQGMVPAPAHVSRAAVTNDKRPALRRALSAAKAFLRINTARWRVAPSSAPTVAEPHRPVTVYNLTLDHDNAYYANGVLVANCLTFAYPVVSAAAGGGGAVSSQPIVDFDPYA